MMQRWTCLASCIAIFVGAGCGGGTDAPKLAETVPLEGTVTMDGKPLVGATVVFHPKTEGGFQGAIGVTDESGKYALESNIGNNITKKGVIPGKYNVTVSRIVTLEGKVIKYDPNVPPMNTGGREEIPMQYSSVNDQGLFFEVPAGGGKFDITISSSGGSTPGLIP